jgi:hypothetical protein
MKKIIIFLLGIIVLNSCASIFNKDTAVIKISSDKKSQVIFKQDTLQIHKKQIKIRPKRAKEVVKLTVLKDSLQKDVYLESKISTLFWANILYTYGLGMIVDLTNDKRFTYKHNLHFVTDSITNTIEISNKKITSIPKNSFFIYTSPLQFLDFFNIPMATVGTEYFPIENFSVSAEAGFRFTDFSNRDVNIEFLDEKARLLRFEGKWYNAINLSNNVHLNEYIGLEYRQIKSQYNDNLEYFNRNGLDNLIIDDFATVKTVSIINLKYGILMPIGDNFYFDFYTGLGVRTKQFDYRNLEYDRQIHEITNDGVSILGIRRFKDYDKRTFLNYSLGFKFGLKF